VGVVVAEQVPPFVSTSWLTPRREDVRIVDCRWSLDGSVGRGDYLAGHVPGAVYADLDTDLAGPASTAGGRHPLPDPDDFALAMQRLGIHDDTPVVAYDTAGGIIAARLVWMLRILGHPAAVLDGGPGDLGSALEEGEVDVAEGSFRPRPWPRTAVAAMDDVAAISAGTVDGLVVDARPAVRFRGEVEPVDARPGHVPGAVNLPVTDAVRDGRLRDDVALRSDLASVGADRAADVVWSCGSGVTAAHGALVMEHLGFDRPRVFVGSWSAWSADPDRPTEIGSGSA